VTEGASEAGLAVVRKIGTTLTVVEMTTGPEELETDSACVTTDGRTPAAVSVATGADWVTVSVTVTVTGAHAPAGLDGADPPAAALDSATTVMYLVDVIVDVRVVVELTSCPPAVLVVAGTLDASPPGDVA
jgi:hypothetical protein